MSRSPLPIERAVGDWTRAHLPFAVAELVVFLLKQAWAALFALLLLVGIILSSQLWQIDWPLARYDFLVLYAVGLQILFLALKLETWAEARVILLFHLTATLMEVFKVNHGSWSYPEAGVLKLMNVPLFSGFMYASVGSYMARVIRLFDMRFAPYPPFWMTALLALAIYVNFFSHHFLPDIRVALFFATLIVFLRTRIWFQVSDTPYWMPLPLAAFLSAIALWVAENIGTMTRTWLYHGQTSDQMVSLAKIGSWYLLLYVSFVTVTLVLRDALHAAPLSKKSAPFQKDDQQHESRYQVERKPAE